MCSQIMLCQMVGTLAAPPDWEVVHFNPRIFRLNPTDESGSGGEAAAKLQEKGHMSFKESFTSSSHRFDCA